MLGYMLHVVGILKGFGYLRKTGDFIGDNLTRRLLRRILVLDAPCRSTEDAENKIRGLIFTVGNKVRQLSVENGIRTEDAASNLRGDIVILSQFVKVIFVYRGLIPSRKARHSYRLLNKADILL